VAARLGRTRGSNRGLVCVDLDHPRALALADFFLPETGMVDGRPGKPRSHFWYVTFGLPAPLVSTQCQYKGGPKTVQYRLPGVGMLLELKGTGSQCVVPPSVWAGGDRREVRSWHRFDGPAEVWAVELYEACRNLALACGWKEPTPPVCREGGGRKHCQPLSRDRLLGRAGRYLAKVPPAVSGQGGHARTFKTACRLVRLFGLTREEVKSLLRDWNRTCVPPWSEADLDHKADDACRLATI
jgi:hypothetical protein